MRINIYSQELTSETKLIAKIGLSSEGQHEIFRGIRLYLHSPEQLHHTPNDDDRSAITIWLPKSSTRRQELANTLYEMAQEVENIV